LACGSPVNSKSIDTNSAFFIWLRIRGKTSSKFFRVTFILKLSKMAISQENSHKFFFPKFSQIFFSKILTNFCRKFSQISVENSHKFLSKILTNCSQKLSQIFFVENSHNFFFENSHKFLAKIPTNLSRKISQILFENSLKFQKQISLENSHKFLTIFSRKFAHISQENSHNNSLKFLT